MATLLPCPTCQASLDLNQAEAGQEVRCTRCWSCFRIVRTGPDEFQLSEPPLRLEPIAAAAPAGSATSAPQTNVALAGAAGSEATALGGTLSMTAGGPKHYGPPFVETAHSSSAQEGFPSASVSTGDGHEQALERPAFPAAPPALATAPDDVEPWLTLDSAAAPGISIPIPASEEPSWSATEPPPSADPFSVAEGAFRIDEPRTERANESPLRDPFAAPPFGPPAEVLTPPPLPPLDREMELLHRLAGQLWGPPPKDPGGQKAAPFQALDELLPAAEAGTSATPSEGRQELFLGGMPGDEDDDEDEPRSHHHFSESPSGSGMGVVMIGGTSLQQHSGRRSHPTLDERSPAPGDPSAGPALSASPVADDMNALPSVGTTAALAAFNLAGAVVIFATVLWIAFWGWKLWSASSVPQSGTFAFMLAVACTVGVFAGLNFLGGSGRIACLIFDLFLIGWCLKLWPRVQLSLEKGEDTVDFFSLHASSPGRERVILWAIAVLFSILTLAILGQLAQKFWRAQRKAKLQPSSLAARASSSGFTDTGNYG